MSSEIAESNKTKMSKKRKRFLSSYKSRVSSIVEILKRTKKTFVKARFSPRFLGYERGVLSVTSGWKTAGEASLILDNCMSVTRACVLLLSRFPCGFSFYIYFFFLSYTYRIRRNSVSVWQARTPEPRAFQWKKTRALNFAFSFCFIPWGESWRRHQFSWANQRALRH